MLKHTDWTMADYIADDIRFDGEVWMERKGVVGIALLYDYTADALNRVMKILRDCADAAEWCGNANITFNDTTFKYRNI